MSHSAKQFAETQRVYTSFDQAITPPVEDQEQLTPFSRKGGHTKWYTC